MASIKNLKSKGRAVLFDPLGREYSAEYALRKRQFADLPPATVIHPLRTIRKVHEQALQAWSRSFVDGQPQQPFPYAEDTTYRTAVIAAREGKGHLLHRLAA